MEELSNDLKQTLLLKLSDRELVNICKSSKIYRDYCNTNQKFWLNRILTKFPYIPLNILNRYKKDRTWSDYYIQDLIKIHQNDLKRSVRNHRFDHILISLDKGAIFKEKYFQELISEELEILLTYFLKGQDFVKICNELSEKLKIRDQTLVNVLFGEDGLIPYWSFTDILFHLILLKIVNPKEFTGEYNIVKENYEQFGVNLNDYIQPDLEINETEKKYIFDELNEINPVISTIKKQRDDLTDVEIIMILLIFNKFKNKKYKFDITWNEICQTF